MNLLLLQTALGQTTRFNTELKASELLLDFEVLQKVLKQCHPGLYRYQDSAAVAQHFETLKKELNHDQTTSSAYLAISRFTAKLKCGHTFCNYNNQHGAIKDSIFNLGDKVPFTFFLFQNRMFIFKDLSGSNAIPEGSEVLSIQNITVKRIIDSLITYVKGDGANYGKRLMDLNLTGIGKYEAFDIFFPLLVPPLQGEYVIGVKKAENSDQENVIVKSISRTERFQRMEKRYGKQPANFDDLWVFNILNANIAYLKLGTFVTNKLTIDWKKFLAKAFAEVKAKGISYLIIDIRGNEGGDDEVNLVLADYLATKSIVIPEQRQMLAYEKIPEAIKPYLNTWDDGFFDRTGKLKRLPNGYYTWKKDRNALTVDRNEKAFGGKVYLLVNEANSSATFFLAYGLQQNKLATLIGTETGGNLKGTNGGQLFFLRLPNSKIEIDVPLIGYYPIADQPDKGVTPDVLILPSLDDMLQGKDKVLEKALLLTGYDK